MINISYTTDELLQQYQRDGDQNPKIVSCKTLNKTLEFLIFCFRKGMMNCHENSIQKISFAFRHPLVPHRVEQEPQLANYLMWPWVWVPLSLVPLHPCQEVKAIRTGCNSGQHQLYRPLRMQWEDLLEAEDGSPEEFSPSRRENSVDEEDYSKEKGSTHGSSGEAPSSRSPGRRASHRITPTSSDTPPSRNRLQRRIL